MKFSFAPMEGITGYVFRNVHARCFPGMDRYFAPFLTANQNLHFKHGEMEDISPENNRDIHLIPQVLANKPGELVWAVRFLEDEGYDEVNLNLGCPSPTVLRQHRGAAMLKDPESLDRFFDESFSCLKNDRVKISVKTRSGFDSAREFEAIAGVLNRYPFSEIILHPRTAGQLYEGKADRMIFRQAAGLIRHPLVCNGDILGPDDISDIQNVVPDADSFMIGRGLLVNPALVRELRGGPCLSKDELKTYHDRLLSAYLEQFHQERTVLFRMKELWTYLGKKLDAEDRLKRRVIRASSLSEYRAAVRQLLSAGKLKTADLYPLSKKAPDICRR